ncbi:hypothetical protein B0H10DRAFT_1965258 [Mycena sp. CBHHK59/15]|nr:hypothetical protein B0H10DRAFT_1965258 [Mycena sp. CBHHK59/15]
MSKVKTRRIQPRMWSPEQALVDPASSYTTAWYQSRGASRISEPSELPTGAQVLPGQLFVHCTEGSSFQIWIRKDDNQEWVSIQEGHVHTFGAEKYCLCLKNGGKPSWIQPKTYSMK